MRVQVLGDELPGVVAKHAQVLCCDVRVVDDNLVAVATADPHLRAGDAEAGSDLAVARQDLHPDGIGAACARGAAGSVRLGQDDGAVHHRCTAARKRLPSVMAAS